MYLLTADEFELANPLSGLLKVPLKALSMSFQVISQFIFHGYQIEQPLIRLYK